MKVRELSLAAAALLGAGPALAAIPSGPVPQPSAAPVETPTCRESFPVGGSSRPLVTEKFPSTGKAGQALVLDLVLEHGKGETVLPGGTSSENENDQTRALESAGFVLPNPKGDAGPKLETTVTGERARSHLTITVVALPKKSGEHALVLPPLPVAVARASGEVRTLCTSPHPITIQEPNRPGDRPKQNPKGLRQREEWTALKHAAIGLAVAAAVFALGWWLSTLWKRRPKPVVPPPPPRPPWDVALEELFDVRHARLVEQGRFAEHFDRVSDAVRRYLGARYGFDGLETTTREAMSALRKVTPRIAVLTEVQAFLENADLVKFAKLTPTEPECEDALSRAEEIVKRTMPERQAAPATADAAAAAPSTKTGGAP
ncbi:MAG TPA: hypothetical protein VHE30_12870 [Polyangiaceae bacterium]|nr:hypothetical protein [Polyangiaceae bacterium]